MSDAVLVAKMFLNSVLQGFSAESLQTEQIRLNAVYGTSQEDPNRKWAQATPSGSLELTISNKEALGKVKPGYYKVLLVPCNKED